MGAMASPFNEVRVKVDRQGRLVLPHALRDGVVTVPGEVVLIRTADGLLLRPTTAVGKLKTAKDGLPVLALEVTITNAEVLAAIAAERSER